MTKMLDAIIEKSKLSRGGKPGVLKFCLTWCRGRDSSPRLLVEGACPLQTPDYESGALARLGYPGILGSTQANTASGYVSLFALK